MAEHIAAIQHALRAAGLDGWLFYDFRGSDPLAARILRLDPHRHTTRRWYYLIPAQGTATKILHRIEPHSLDDVPGDSRLYLSWQEQHQHVREALLSVTSGAQAEEKGSEAPASPGRARGAGASEPIHMGARAPVKIAMQYSPMNAIPYISRVDAGTVELVRSFGVEVVTSADLVQRFEAVWNNEQYQSHCQAAAGLQGIVTETFERIKEDILASRVLTERDIQLFILDRIASRGLYTYAPPIVAVNAHAADPHYSPPKEGSSLIKSRDLVLIDLWAKATGTQGIYADITWTGFVGEVIPPEHAKIFTVVAAGRDAAIAFLQKEVSAGHFPTGGEVDNVCRSVIQKAGYGDRFIHRTGHSIGEEVHGNGANIDNLETQDSRRLLPHTCFSIEPGVYLPGQFGIRSEVDAYLTEREAIVTTQPIQTAIVPILAS